MTPVSFKTPGPPSQSGKPAQPKAPQGARFQAAMPQIPGVKAENRAHRDETKKRKWIIAAVGAALVLSAGAGWRMLRSAPRANAPASEAEAPSTAPPELPPPSMPARAAQTATNEIGTLAEFARPWTFKKFQYSHGLTRDSVPAVAIRLPIGDGRGAASYWGILLKAPYGQCDLEFVTNVSQISAKFGFSASHPMVVDPCSSTVYDPLRMGTLPNGSWARGEIVQGAGFRPPLQVEIRIEGDKIIAGRSED